MSTPGSGRRRGPVGDPNKSASEYVLADIQRAHHECTDNSG